MRMTPSLLLSPGSMSCALLGATLCVSSSALAAQPAAAPAAAPAIAVSGIDAASQELDAAALAKLPQHSVHAEAHGHALDCTGANLIDVVAAAGAPSGEKLRGKNLEYVVRVSASDGYRVVFALAELDPAMRDAVPIVTDRCDGKPLDDKEGPFRVIVPGEKRPARWIRQVTGVEVLKLP